MKKDGGGIEPASTRGVGFDNDDKHYLFSGDEIRKTYKFFSGEYEYEYQLGQNAAQDSTLRGATITENVAVLPSTSTSHSREYHDNQDYDYQYRSQTSGEVNDLSHEFAKTFLNDERLPSTDSAPYDGYQSNEGQQGMSPSRGKKLELSRHILIESSLGRTSTEPIPIPPNSRRQADEATSSDYSSSSHSTVVGRQSGFPGGKFPSPPSGLSLYP
jgi:hypothetical protein